MGSVCSTCIHVSVLPCYRVEAGAEKGSRRRSRGARTPDARHGTGDTRVSCTHGDRACFPRVHRHNTPSQLHDSRHTGTHGTTHTQATHRVSRKCVTRCRPEAYPLRISRAYDTHRRPGRPARRVTALRPGYVRANCTHITSSHLSTAVLYTGGSAADASLHNTYPRGFTRPRAHGPCHMADGM